MEQKELIIHLGQSGLVCEGHEQFEGSIFRRVYKEAEKQVQYIIEENEKREEQKKYGIILENAVQVENIIGFIGNRGTGKTSAMFSFMEALRKHNRGSSVLKTMESGIGKDCVFEVLDWIDAARLEQEEDIFDMILAKMMGEFLKKDKEVYYGNSDGLDYENRKLSQQFEKVYKRVLSLKKRDTYEIDTAIVALRDLARSNQIREEFIQLIELYNSFLKNLDGRNNIYHKKTYLVVAIDDIDLNITRGREILEKLYRYLMVPGVIILTAFNYGEMLLSSGREYVEGYNKMPQSLVTDVGERAKIINKSYLEKIFPLDRRIYLPSFKKTDYGIKDFRKIEVDGKRYSIKKGMFYLIWKKTGLYYDALGKKPHFMVPNILRNLNTNFNNYNHMTDLPANGKENFWEIYNENYYRMVDDILFRFANDELVEKEYKRFRKWSEEDILRRGEEIVNDVIEKFPSLDKERGEISKINAELNSFPTEYSQLGYGYGELMRSFYCMTRKEIYSKAMVRLLLAQYTTVFGKVYMQYFNGKDEKTKDKNKAKLKELMKNSIGGSWTNYMLPIDGGSYTYNYIIKNIKVEDRKIFSFEKSEMNDLIKEKSWEKCKKLLSSPKMEKFAMSMFFLSNYKRNKNQNEKYTFKIFEPQSVGVSEEEKNPDGDKYTFYIEAKRVDFSILNFVNTSFEYKEVLTDFYIAIIESFIKNGYLENIEDIKTTVDNWLIEEEQKENTLITEFKNWEKTSGALALPIYNFDITYNLLKRLVKENKSRGNYSISKDEVYDYFLEFLENIKTNLQEQDNFYNKEEEKEEKDFSNFSKCFVQCPIVARLVKDTEKEYKTVLLCFFDGKWENNTTKTVIL